MTNGVEVVVLVGGRGTRLFPLTESVCKPLVKVVDRSLLDLVFEPVRDWARVTAFCLAAGFRSPDLAAWTARREAVQMLVEEQPLGTGGAVAHACRGRDATVWVQNGDALLWPDAEAFYLAHRRAGVSWSVMVTQVSDASRYGQVDFDPVSGRLQRFREKGPDRGPGWINAGIYLLEPELYRRLPEGSSSLERDWFPHWLDHEVPGQAWPYSGYFCDLGTPHSYQQAVFDRVEGRMPGGGSAGGVWQGEGTVVDPTAQVIGPAVLGPGCRVMAGARLERSILGAECRVGEGVGLLDVVTGDGCQFGDGVQLSNLILGAGAALARVRPQDDEGGGVP